MDKTSQESFEEAREKIHLKIRFYYKLLELLGQSQINSNLLEARSNSMAFLNSPELEIEAIIKDNIPIKIKNMDAKGLSMTSPFINERARQITIASLANGLHRFLQDYHK